MTQFNKTCAGALALATLLGGCSGTWPDPHGYLDRRDTIALSAGDAIASNNVTQMYDPWPAYSANTNIAFNGQRAQTAVERYRNGRVIVPRGIASSSAYAPSMPDPSGTPTANTTPLGPTVTQSGTSVK